MTAIEAVPPPAGTGSRRLAWRQAEVVERVAETRRATTLVRDVPGWPGHLAGQHVDVRLTAEDGYQAQRSYSIASPPEVPQLALTVERLERGEVSPWLVDEARPGDRFELRGPIGGYFAWSVAAGGPLDAPMLAEVGFAPKAAPKVFVCGPTPMVEEVAEALVGLGHEPARVKTKRFGATGGG